MSASTLTAWTVGIAGGALALYGLHRLALRLERDGWIRYVQNPPNAGAGGGAALGELQQFLEPQTRHVFELKNQKPPRRDDGGGPGPPEDAGRPPGPC